MMIVSLIVAMDQQRGIGFKGQLPWRLKADLQHFKRRTMGHTLLMGRKTFESIGRALPGRKMLILTRQPAYRPEKCPEPACRVIPSIDEGISIAAASGEDELFIIGGAEIFALSIGYAQRIYLTHVQAACPADVHFPKFDLQNWHLKETFFQPADEDNQYPFTFSLYERFLAGDQVPPPS